ESQSHRKFRYQRAIFPILQSRDATQKSIGSFAYWEGAEMASGDLELVARDVSVQFDGLKALSGVTLTVPRGRITGLIGPNGAGKTTLINVLTGFQPVDTGALMLEGEAVNGIPAHQLRRKGIARTFQSGRLFRDLRVIDNLEVTGVGLGESRRDAIAE